MLQARWQRDEGHCVVAGIHIDEDLRKGKGVIGPIQENVRPIQYDLMITGFYITSGLVPAWSEDTPNVRLLNWL